MDFIFAMARKNLEFFAEMQERRQAAAKIATDFATAAYQQNFATMEALMDIAAEQNKAMSKFVSINEAAFEETVKESSAAAVKAAEQIAKGTKGTKGK